MEQRGAHGTIGAASRRADVGLRERTAMMQGLGCSCGFFLVGPPFDPFDVEHVYHKKHCGEGHIFVWLSSWEMVWEYWLDWKQQRYGGTPDEDAGHVNISRSYATVR
jgi:hypothetical protein